MKATLEYLSRLASHLFYGEVRIKFTKGEVKRVAVTEEFIEKTLPKERDHDLPD